MDKANKQDSSIAERFKTVRKECGLTQKEIAEIMNVSQGTVTDIERGKIGLSKKNAKSLEENTIINTGWIYTGIGEKYSKKIQGKNTGYDTGFGKKSINETQKEMMQEEMITNVNIRLLRDALTLYSTYSTEAIRVLPEDLKELNAVLSALFVKTQNISEMLVSSKIRQAIDVENRFDDFFNEERDLPNFETYINNKTSALKSLLEYKNAFKRIFEDLQYYQDILNKIDLGLPINAQIKPIN